MQGRLLIRAAGGGQFELTTDHVGVPAAEFKFELGTE